MATETSSNTTTTKSRPATDQTLSDTGCPTSYSSSTNSPTCLQIVVEKTKVGVQLSVKSLRRSSANLLKRPARQEYILLLPPNVPQLSWSRETLKRTSL